MGERHVRAIRGATTVARDDAELIRVATRELLEQIVARNALVPEDIISVVFTVTADLTSEFPAHAARAHSPRSARRRPSSAPALLARSVPTTDELWAEGRSPW